MQKFHGLYAAHFSVFDSRGEIDKDLIHVYVEHLINQGVAGVFVNGSNGEGPNLTTAERMTVAEAFKEAARDRIKLIIHVGHASIGEAKILAWHAQQIGADAVSSVAAFYFKPTSVYNLVDCMASIASAAPELPFFYYHIPSLTGVEMDMVTFLEEGSRKIPNLKGIKYSAPTLWEFQACLEVAGETMDVLYGTDEMLLSALAVGAKGAVGSTYNFAAPLYLEMIRLFNEGRMEEAGARQALLVNMVRAFLRYPHIPAQKAIMKMIGFDLGACRLPLQRELSKEQYDELFVSLEKINFFKQLKNVGSTGG